MARRREAGMVDFMSGFVSVLFYHIDLTVERRSRYIAWHVGPAPNLHARGK